jgi:DNA-binding NarL/FixJ family response regulator
MARLAIVDDQAMVKAGLRMILETQPDFEVVGEAADGAEAVDLVMRERPDVTLMDIRMPTLDGIAATRSISGTTKVVILTTYEQDEYVFAALSAGASAFLLKSAPPEDLIRAVRVVLGGDGLLSPSVTKRLINEFAARHVRHPSREAIKELTERESEVLLQVARGLSNAEIASELHVSEATVKTHVAHLLDKLDLRDRVQAVILAYESGLVE